MKYGVVVVVMMMMTMIGGDSGDDGVEVENDDGGVGCSGYDGGNIG